MTEGKKIIKIIHISDLKQGLKQIENYLGFFSVLLEIKLLVTSTYHFVDVLFIFSSN